MKLPFSCLHVSSPANLNGLAAGRALLGALNQASSLVPDRYNNFEPIRQPYRPDDLDTVLQSWTWPFLWTRNRPRSEGSIYPADANHPKHSSLKILVRDTKRVPIEDLCRLLYTWATVATADFGLVHLFTEAERARAATSGTLMGLDRAGKLFTFNLPSHRIQANIPDLYWMTLLGEPYIQMFGRDVLLSAPAHAIHEAESGHITLQLSESLHDLESDYRHVAAVRDRVIDHLGANAFFSPERTAYRTPQFSFYAPGSE